MPRKKATDAAIEQVPMAEEKMQDRTESTDPTEEDSEMKAEPDMNVGMDDSPSVEPEPMYLSEGALEIPEPSDLTVKEYMNPDPESEIIEENTVDGLTIPEAVSTEPIFQAEAVLDSAVPGEDNNGDQSLAEEQQSAPAERVVSITAHDEIVTPEAEADVLWHDIQNANRNKRILTGTLGGIEQTEGGSVIAVVYYRGLRVLIPAKEFLTRPLRQNPGEMPEQRNDRVMRTINRMLGAEIDFVIRGIDSRSRSVVASRKSAALRKRNVFYIQPDLKDPQRRPLIHEGRVVEARVISVSEGNIVVDVFGVESTIASRRLTWEWFRDARDRYSVGQRVLIKILRVNVREDGEIQVSAADARYSENEQAESLSRCKVQGHYAGTITSIYKGVVFVHLGIGVNAVAHSCIDRRMPGKGDEVSFVVTHIDRERGVAVGLISRIIRQNL